MMQKKVIIKAVLEVKDGVQENAAKLTTRATALLPDMSLVEKYTTRNHGNLGYFPYEHQPEDKRSLSTNIRQNSVVKN